jgi:hypothetical protein
LYETDPFDSIGSGSGTYRVTVSIFTQELFYKLRFRSGTKQLEEGEKESEICAIELEFVAKSVASVQIAAVASV